jgi:hypothetical protein
MFVSTNVCVDKYSVNKYSVDEYSVDEYLVDELTDRRLFVASLGSATP